MNRIRMIAVVLSMVLFLVGASGNTEEKTDQIQGRSEVVIEQKCENEPRRQEEIHLEELHREEIKEKESSPEEVELEKPQWEEQTPEEEEPQEIQEISEQKMEIAEDDYTALLKIVEAEASGEDVKGKMLVANVVLNRVRHGAFGSTIKEVIYQRVNGKAQFSPVATGKIECVVVSEETVEAVERVLCGEDESQGALYFAARAYANPENMAWFDRNLTWLFQYNGHEFYS